MSSKQAWRTTMMPDVATRSSITPYTIFWGATGLDAAAAAGVGSVRCQEVVGPWIVGSGRRLATGDHPTHRTRGHSMGEAWIIDAVRTPRGVGKPGKGALAHLHPQRLGSTVLRRSEEHTSELQSLMRISYAVFCLKKQTTHHTIQTQILPTCQT